MRLVEWNVCGGFAFKIEHLMDLRPDVAILSEVSPARRWPSVPGPAVSGVSRRVWSESRKELAVLARAPWRASPLEVTEPAPPWVLPVRIEGPVSFTVVACWPVQMPGASTYVRQLSEAAAWMHTLGSTRDVVFGGDLNAPIPSSRRQFDRFDEQLGHVGLVDSYRAARALTPGQQPTEATYFHQRRADRPFHIDHVYIPTRWTRGLRVTVGDHPAWVASGRSDHVPVVVDVADRRPDERTRAV